MPDFGYAPPVLGDRLFGRMDGRDLRCQHLGCLVSFCGAVVRETAGVEGREVEGVGEEGGVCGVLGEVVQGEV